MKKWNYLVVVGAIGLASCGGGGNPSNPKPATVLPPSARPDLSTNAILLSDNTVLGCNEYSKLKPPVTADSKNAVSALSTSNQPAQSLMHEEPPIGGEDGSFRLHMETVSLLGTTGRTKKACTAPDHNEHGGWELHWRIWDSAGAVAKQSSQGIPVPIDTPVLICFAGTNNTVSITRKTDTGGTAWNSETTASFTAPLQPTALPLGLFGTKQAHDLIEPNAASIRMRELKIGAVNVPLSVTGLSNTCSGFVICHDGNGCKIPEPKQCLAGKGATGTATPGGQTGHTHK